MEEQLENALRDIGYAMAKFVEAGGKVSIETIYEGGNIYTVFKLSPTADIKKLIEKFL